MVPFCFFLGREVVVEVGGDDAAVDDAVGGRISKPSIDIE
jgi:hypothetical protein